MSRLEHCAEIEPKLLDFAVRMRSLTPEVAAKELHSLVGRQRFTEDWDRTVGSLKVPVGMDPETYRLRKWEEHVPMEDPRRRLYNHPGSDTVFDNISAELGLKKAPDGSFSFSEPFAWPEPPETRKAR